MKREIAFPNKGNRGVVLFKHEVMLVIPLRVSKL